MKYGKEITELLNIIEKEAQNGNKEARDWLNKKGYIRIIHTKKQIRSEFTYSDSERTSIQGNLFREQILKRDNYKCVKCNSGGKLQVHHIKSWAKFPNERFNEQNCITLCINCHIKEHPKLAGLIRNAKYKEKWHIKPQI